MRYVFGTLTMTAALIIVGYSASTLFTAAFTAMSTPWAAYLAGIGIGAVVAWEAGAALMIGNAFRTGHYAIGAASFVLLLLAMVVTFRYELRVHIGGQADVLAQRDDARAKREYLASELDAARRGRDKLAAISRPTIAQSAELRQSRARIADLEKRWDTRVETVGEAMPEAAWAGRVTGMTEGAWRDIWLAVPLAFWMLARVFAVPLAVVGMSSFKNDDDPRGGKKAFPPLRVPDEIPTPVAAAPALPKPASKPHLVVDNAKPKPKSKAARPEDIDKCLRRWLDAATSNATIPSGTTAADAHAAYVRWCEVHEPRLAVGNNQFGRAMTRAGIAKGRVAGGCVYGVRLRKAAVMTG